MKLLAIDTATEACSVALWLDGAVHERFDVVPRGHAERVLPWAEALLQEADVVRSQLDAIAVSRGPGAFTGVRLAVSLAQGLALALDRPVRDVLAGLTPREAKVLRMRFGIDMNTDHTLEEVGKQFDVTRERIRQIEAKALRKLRHPSRSEVLRSFLDE